MSIREFTAIYDRIHGPPPTQLEPAFQEVWKLLYRFAMEEPMGFYELVLTVTHPKAKYQPIAPWRDRIILRGFAGVDSQEGFVIHDLVLDLFNRHLMLREVSHLPRAAASETPGELSARPRRSKRR